MKSNYDPYDPLQFVHEMGLFTMAVVGSFITWKLLNSLYDNLYEPAIDIIIDNEDTDKYYVKIGKYYVQLNMIFKELIKWIIIVIFLMLMYNLLKKIEK